MINYINKNFLKYIKENTKIKGNKDNCVFLKFMLYDTHKIIWSNNRNILCIYPKKFKFGRIIINISDVKNVKILCNDFKKTSIYSLNDNLTKIKNYPMYDGYIIRLYWNNEWIFTTENSINCKYFYYKTNKNLNVLNIHKSTYELISNMITFDKNMNKNFTYFYVVNFKNMYNLYKVESSNYIYIGKMSNSDNVFIPNKINTDKIKCIGNLYIRDEVNIYKFKKDAYIRHKIIKNIPNVKAIALWNSMNDTDINRFKKYYPYWYKFIDEIQEKKKTLAKLATTFYHNNRRINKNIKRNNEIFYKNKEIFLSWSKWAHSIYLENKEIIEYKHLIDIINKTHPSFIATVLKIWI